MTDALGKWLLTAGTGGFTRLAWIGGIAILIGLVVALSFKVETFAALAAAGGVGFLGRGVEKVAKARAPANITPDVPIGGI